MDFKDEKQFEDAVVDVLVNCGWKDGILNYPTEDELIDNWAAILNENNKHIDKLNGISLTKGEMQQILEQVKNDRTPLKLNGFINGKTVTIKRDNPEDALHFGKEVALKIYDRHEIAAGQSRYQIARQPKFKTKSKMLNSRRGDLTLLINGMPVIHIELKNKNVPLSNAYNQIEKYMHEGVFTGIYSLVQVFVAMKPDEAKYFANPGPDGNFNPAYYFNWADFNNEPIMDWKTFTSQLLSIPMAHQLIGFYTVADTSDGILKVLRSYQYHAVNAISDKVAKIHWDEKGHQLGGYIWHTTGSGKTMTSFKAAQLIASSKDADKVVFLTDRIELGTQSLKEYRSFASEREEVQATENTYTLISKLKSNNPSDTLIVTSIQKMSRIKDEENGLNAYDIEVISNKRLVFIVDEAHRSTFGEMLMTIKDTFPNAVFFGFTGTPIHDENQKKMNTTATVFGDELHRYSIADGIRDKNVLGFDPYKVMTFKDKELRKAVALEKAKAQTELQAINDDSKSKIYYDYMDPSTVPMAGYIDKSGKYIKGIEDYVPNSQYRTDEHREKVIEDIGENFSTLSMGIFHGIFATSSIPEAIEYYRLIKKRYPDIKVTCLFDPTIDDCGGTEFKEDGLVELMEDYNKMYGMDFTIPKHAAFKKDIAMRLAHKDIYKRIENDRDKQLDLLIVVDQMLTGFDSKWVNTLYLDKVLEYENVIQAFSRTNRLFNEKKRFGIIRYYRRPHTMEKNIERAVKLYSGDKPIGLFVEKLQYNIKKINELYEDISELFKNAGIENFKKLPDDYTVRAKFAQMFNKLNAFLDAAMVQGFRWEKDSYKFKNPDTAKEEVIVCEITKKIYLTLVQRYKELLKDSPDGDLGDIPYDISGYITEINTDRIDTDYMNSRFQKYLKVLQQDNKNQAELDKALAELHKTFAALSQEEQKYANIFLHDVERGDVIPEENKTLRDYITEYQYNAKNTQIHKFALTFGLDESLLRNMMNLNLTEKDIDAFGRFTKLKSGVDKQKAKAYFEEKENIRLNPPKVNIKMDSLLRKFILQDGFEL